MIITLNPEAKMNKKVLIYTSSVCRRQNLDARRLSDYFLKNGYIIVTNPKKADYIILCTCGYSNKMAQVSLDAIEKLQKFKAELIVAGCLPAIEEKKLNEIFDGKKIITKDINKFDELFKDNKIKMENIDDTNILWPNRIDLGLKNFLIKISNYFSIIKKIYLKIRTYVSSRLLKNKYLYEKKFREMERAYYLRISRGCIGNCSYCAIKKAVGPLKSKSLDECITEFKKGLNKGHNNFIIVADNLGAYGIDIGLDFPKLLNEILKIEGDYKIELEELHPMWLVKYINEFEKIISKHKIRRICLPLQSASPRILKLMNRFSDIESIKKSINKLVKIDPDLILETHFIVGFPSETEEDFKDTINFLKEVKFDYGRVFPFSRKIGTKAETIEPKVSPDVINKRKRYLDNQLKGV